MRSSFRRVYVEKFCEICGKVEFEGTVFGKDSYTHLQATEGTREMRCDCHRVPAPFKVTGLSSFFTNPDAFPVDGEK